MAELHRRELLVGSAAGLGLLAAGCTSSSPGSGSAAGTTPGTGTGTTAGTGPGGRVLRADFDVDHVAGPATLAVNADGVQLQRGPTPDTVIAVDRGAVRWSAVVGSPDPTRPHGIAAAATAPDGSWWVINRSARTVRHVTTDGKVDITIDAPGSESGHAGHATALSVGADGTLYVADAADARITVHAPDGSVTGRFAGRSEDGNPVAIAAISAEGDGLWVLERGRPSLVRYQLASKAIDQRVTLGRPSGHHVMTTTKDHVYVGWGGALHRTPIGTPGTWEAHDARTGQIVALHRANGEALTVSLSAPIPWAR